MYKYRVRIDTGTDIKNFVGSICKRFSLFLRNSFILLVILLIANLAKEKPPI